MPYGDHFFQRESWHLVSTSENSLKSIMRADNQLIFVKSTVFRSSIASRSEVEIKAYFKQWKADVESKGYLDPAMYLEARKNSI